MINYRCLGHFFMSLARIGKIGKNGKKWRQMLYTYVKFVDKVEGEREGEVSHEHNTHMRIRIWTHKHTYYELWNIHTKNVCANNGYISLRLPPPLLSPSPSLWLTSIVVIEFRCMRSAFPTAIAIADFPSGFHLLFFPPIAFLTAKT